MGYIYIFLVKFGSEEVRLAPLTPVPTILSKTILLCFAHQKMFRNSLHNFYGHGDPDLLFYFLPLPGFS